MALVVADQHSEVVVLLHGLGRTSWSMWPLQRALAKHFRVINRTYPSRRFDVATLSQRAVAGALSDVEPNTKVHFVTHSLGGILLRHYLSKNTVPNLGRVVMLGPPNQGSALVDHFLSKPNLGKAFRWILGPAVMQLSARPDSFVRTLPKADFELAVIAGSKCNNPYFNKILRAPSDGKVTVESTKLAGMAVHQPMMVDHTFMLMNRDLIKSVSRYLRTGALAPQ